MMNRFNKLFGSKSTDVLSIYFCAGTPQLDNTVEVISTLEQSGVDMIEIGIPFSDPMADGVVIQEAATRALNGGMTLKLLFQQLAGVRDSVSMPLVLMGYLNPIMQYGFERFCVNCKECGIDGVIIPDMPFDYYVNDYKDIAQKYGVNVIMLITPETEEERVRIIDENSDSFIYMVSSASTTGAQVSFEEQKLAYFKRIADMNLKNPRMIGFGISNKETFDAACKYASGAIIGSKFVTLLEQTNNPQEAINSLKHSLGVL